jgi:hypothetical protein
VDKNDNRLSNAVEVIGEIANNVPGAIWEELSNDWNNQRTSTLLSAGSAFATGAAATFLCRRFPATAIPVMALAGTGTLLYGGVKLGSFLGESMDASSESQRAELIQRGTNSVGKAGAFAVETMPALLLGSRLVPKSAGTGLIYEKGTTSRATASDIASPSILLEKSKPATAVMAAAPAETSATIAAQARAEDFPALVERIKSNVPKPLVAEALVVETPALADPSRVPPPQYTIDASKMQAGRPGNFYSCAAADPELAQLKIEPGHPNPMLAQYELARDSGKLQQYKSKLITKYAHAVPTEESLRFIGEHGPVVELGAGNGYWASLLKNRGYDTVAYDAWSGYAYSPGATWTEVLKGDAKMLAKHPDRTLFISWPSNGAASDALIHFKGNKFAYLGEQSSDIMGDNQFFQILKRDWKEVRSMPVPSLDGFNQDALYFYERKTRVEKLLDRHREKMLRQTELSNG